MRPLFYYVFKKFRFLVMWSHDLHGQSIEKDRDSKTLEVISDLFLIIYTRVERFGVWMGWLIREPYYVDKAIKNSEDRLERLIKLKAPEVIIDNEKKILTKRRWAKQSGFKTMEEFHENRGK